ncbi:MAG: winged helix-turn-helix transcriptional regulator [bacterium]
MKVPVMKEVPNKGWVLFGEDNKFPNMLLNMFNKSSKHNGIVLGKVNYITGKGFDHVIQANAYENCNEILKKACLDIEVFGGCYLEIQYNELGKIGAFYHVPYHKVRSSKDNTQFYVKDWESYKKNDEPKVFAAYNPKLEVNLLRNQTQILYYKEYRPGVETYSYPGYMGALNAIQTDIEISKYHLSTITNGMFASKMISFFEGIPTEEEKREIEKGFKSKFTGSENAGNIVLNFGKDPAKRPQLDDLSSTELDKHFDILSKSVQTEIFCGHQVVSPMLFGIRVEGQLGGRSEIREAYEIMKSTYVNDKQQALELLFKEITGQEHKIIPVEPIGFEFSEQTLLQIAPKKWLLEKIGIDASLYPEIAQPEGVAPQSQPMAVIENLKNLSGRQWQSLTRIIRKFEKGEISQEQAKLLLKSSVGLNDDEVNTMLAIDNGMEFSSHEKDELLLAEFAKCGEPKNDYLIVKKNKFLFVDNEFKFLSQVELDVMDLIRKDKRITPSVISDVLGLELPSVNQILSNLEKIGKIVSKVKAVGPDQVVERVLTESIASQIIKDQKEKIAEVKEVAPGTSPKIPKLEPETLNFKILYSYEGPQDARNRPFCARLMAMDKLWSRSEIESMSRRLGYSVFDRGGGWWTQPDGTRSKSCRHDWISNVVMKKEK